MYSKLLLLLTAFFAATLWFGCDDDRMAPPPDGTDPDGSIQIVTGTPNDTLYFLHGNQATTEVIVILTDDRGLAIAGVDVDIALYDSSLGYIEYLDDELRDTTNSLGRVNMVYHSIGIEGNELISASREGQTAQRVLVVREFDPATFTVDLFFEPDTVYHSSGEFPASMLHVRVMSNGTIPVPGYDTIADGSCTSGSNPPFVSLGPTDVNGVAINIVSFSPGSHSGTTHCIYRTSHGVNFETADITLISVP